MYGPLNEAFMQWSITNIAYIRHHVSTPQVDKFFIVVSLIGDKYGMAVLGILTPVVMAK